MNYKAQINKLKKENAQLRECLDAIAYIRTQENNAKSREAERLANLK